MNNKRKLYIVSFSFIAAFVLFVWGFNFLKGRNLMKHERIFYAQFDNVAGLESTGPIMVNGLQVGQVSDLYFNPTGDGSILMKAIITAEMPIPDNSILKIVSTNVLGNKGVNLALGNSTRMAVSGDTLLSAFEHGMIDGLISEIMPFKAKAEHLLASFDLMLNNINAMLNEENRNNIESSINDLSVTLADLRSNKNAIDSIVLYLNSFTHTLAQSSDEFENISKNFSQFSDSISQLKLNQTLSKLDATLNEIETATAKINSGEGSAGLLLSNDSLYRNLNEVSKQTKQLLELINENPKKYLRISLF